MKRLSAGITLVCCILAGAAPARGAGAVDLDAWARKYQQSGEIAAAAIAEVRGAQIDARGFGRRSQADATAPDAQSRFQIGSITKVFTHLLLAELDEAGVVRYASTVGELMPAPFRPRNPGVASITLQALATHSSGLPRLPANLELSNSVDPYAGYDNDALHQGLAQARDKQPLGRFYSYSNFSAGLLGHLLGRASESSYKQALTTRVIAPLRLQNTAFEPGANAVTPVTGRKPATPWGFQDAFAGAGALWGSVEDLARLVQIYLGTHEHGLRHALKPDLEIALSDAGSFELTRVWHVARADGQPIYWHNGGTAGFHSFVGFRPDQQRGLAILLSGDADPTAIGLEALGYVVPEVAPLQADRSIFGQYQFNPQFGIGVFELEGMLVAQASGQSPLLLHAVGDDWYANGEVDASLHFVRRDGAVVAMQLAQNGIVQTAERVADVAVATTREETAVDAAELDHYVGSFSFAPGVALNVRRRDDGIEAQLTGQPYFPVFARGKDRFFYKVVDAELQFERDASGRVDAVVLHQGGIVQRAPRAVKGD